MQCTRCGASIHEGLHICPHCGARQKRRSTQVTCTHCRYHAHSGSSVCPRCGQVLRARRLPPLILPLAVAVLLAAVFLVVRNSDEAWKPVQQVAQQKLTSAQERLNDLGGKVLDTASSLADDPAPVESPTPTQVIVLAETSVGIQAVRVALAAQETPSADMVVAPTTVSTSTVALTGTVPITAQAVALADTQSAAALELAASPTAAAQESSPTETPPQTPLPAPSPTSTATPAGAVATRTQPVSAANKSATPTATPLPPTPTATLVPPTPTATPLPPTATPTATPVPPTATPTATPESPTATPLPPTVTPRTKASASAAEETTYVVKSGDNWYNIARRYGITQEALASANGLTQSDILQVDQKLRIPSASTAEARSVQSNPKETPAATQTAAASVLQTYTVQRGDNWFSIARRFSITQEALAAYNGRSPADILQVNQKLRIPPVGGAIAKPTVTNPTATKAATPTPESTPTPEPPAVVRLPAPVLLSPMNNDGFSSGSSPVLTWQPVPGVSVDDTYHVRVGFTMVSGERGFAEADVTGTSYTVPQWVFDAAQQPDRLGSWSVQIRRLGPAGEVVEISPSSETWTFYWR